MKEIKRNISDFNIDARYEAAEKEGMKKRYPEEDFESIYESWLEDKKEKDFDVYILEKRRVKTIDNIIK